MKAKQIIQRNLDLTDTYNLIDKNYIPIIDGGGTICQDCGRLISHIALVKGVKQNKHFNVGFDCLTKLLANNTLICNFNAEQLKKYKGQINKVIRFTKELYDIIDQNPNIEGFYFEPQSYKSDWFTYYILRYKGDKGYNMSVKIKDIDYEFLHKTVANIIKTKNIYHGNRN